MAVVAMIFGGVAGYILALLAYLVFGVGLMTALTVWSLGGISILVLTIFAGRVGKLIQPTPARA
jgi:hypothetical protein